VRLGTCLTRCDTTERWAEHDPVLADREAGWDTDLDILKIGDGVHRWSELPAYSHQG
jgi:hypothetical protein